MNLQEFRIPAWSNVVLVVAALTAAVIFLWIALLLAVAFGMLAGLSLLPRWIRGMCARKRRRDGPRTIEGHYTKLIG